MEPPRLPATFRVRRRQPDTGIAVELGSVAAGPRGELAVVAAQPGYAAYLADLTARVNALDALLLKVPPPPDGQPMGVYHLSVGRGAPDLAQRLAEYVEQAFGLTLELTPD